MHRARPLCLIAAAALCCPVWAQVPTFKPGFNLFSKDQDIQLGREAAAQIEKQQQVVHDARLESYVNNIGRRLAGAPLAQGWPFSFKVINDKSVNAFALPGGPMFVNTGAIKGVDDEAQLAGIMAHEMSHVVLRHGTHQVSKANLLNIPAAMIGGAAGSSSMFGKLVQLGVVGMEKSALLSFSRDAERQADLLGAQIMAQAGYNPIELARVFEKLEGQQGGSRSGGLIARFLSDHPDPGNRVQYIEDEIRYLPQRAYNAPSGDFAAAQRIVAGLPTSSKKETTAAAATTGTLPSGGFSSIRPSGRFARFDGAKFTFQYPDNWQVMGDQQASMITIAPQQGIVSAGNTAQVGYGLTAAYYYTQGTSADLTRDTEALLSQFQQQNPGLQVSGVGRRVQINGQAAIVTNVSASSPFRGEHEVDTIVTVARPEGLFYLVLTAPQSEFGAIESQFETIINSLQFNG